LKSIELDKNSEERYEYFDCEIFAMSGGSRNGLRVRHDILGLASEVLLESLHLSLRLSEIYERVEF
jgi:hypothetical protein